VRDLFRAGPGRLHASQGGAVRGQKSEVSAAAGCADRSRVEGGRLREEKILNFANDGPHSASVIRAETLEDAPLTAPLDCSPFPRGAVRRTEGSGELAEGLRVSFFRSFIRARPLARAEHRHRVWNSNWLSGKEHVVLIPGGLKGQTASRRRQWCGALSLHELLDSLEG